MSYAPRVILPKAADQRAFEIESCLLGERKVFFGEQVDSQSAGALVQQLLYLEAQSGKEPVTLYINSPGGSIVDGMAVYDTIRHIACPVHAVVCGMAASMGAVILSGCEKGERSIMPHGEVLLHQPLGGSRGQATDIEISARRILKMKEMLLRILAENTGKDYETVLEDCDRDHWLDPQEAVDYGICDKIMV